jgi:Zn-dependent protease
VSTTAVASGGFARCAECAIELGPYTLACPSCKALVHAPKLKEIAAEAQALAARKDLVGERDAWSSALDLLPPESQQYQQIAGRVAAINNEVATRKPEKDPTAPPWYKRPAAAGFAVIVLLVGKFKFLILGLTKAKTFISMFAFFGWYWNAFGWPLALGLVISIYIHEMGHVAELRKLHINASAPLFIPGIGALVMLKQRVDDPVTDARIGLAGPVYGLAAGIIAAVVAMATQSQIWFAIARLTGFINLFNLIPVWQLDGSRGFHALDRTARWIIVALTLAMLAITQQKMLIFIAAVGAWRAFQKTEVKTHRPTLTTFVMLLIALSFLANIPVALAG